MPSRQDDLTIGDDVVLWRAVHKLQIYTEDDISERAQKWAFESENNEVSAWIAAETDLDRVRARFSDSRIAEFTAAQARECGNIVARDPVADDSVARGDLPTAGEIQFSDQKRCEAVGEKSPPPSMSVPRFIQNDIPLLGNLILSVIPHKLQSEP